MQNNATKRIVYGGSRPRNVEDIMIKHVLSLFVILVKMYT